MKYNNIIHSKIEDSQKLHPKQCLKNSANSVNSVPKWKNISPITASPLSTPEPSPRPKSTFRIQMTTAVNKTGIGNY